MEQKEFVVTAYCRRDAVMENGLAKHLQEKNHVKIIIVQLESNISLE